MWTTHIVLIRLVLLYVYVIEYEKRDHFAVKLIIQYKQLQFSKHYLLYINPIFLN